MRCFFVADTYAWLDSDCSFSSVIFTSAETSDSEGNLDQVLSFNSAMEEIQCVSINIRADNLVEDLEMFVVIFSSDDTRDEFMNDNTTVSIVDDDGKETITVWM